MFFPGYAYICAKLATFCGRREVLYHVQQQFTSRLRGFLKDGRLYYSFIWIIVT